MGNKPYLRAGLAVVLVLAFLDIGFGAEQEWGVDTSWIQVSYDPSLSKSKSNCEFISSGERHQGKVHLKLYRPDVFWLSIRNPRYAGIWRSEILECQIAKGMFNCRLLVLGKAANPQCPVAKRQELTLDKKTYRKGDVATGRIDFECLAECPQCTDKSQPFTVKGVFKAVLK